MHTISAAHTMFAFQSDAAPVLRVLPGAVVRFMTSPAPVERLFAAGDAWLGAVDVRALNAITGPVFVEGAEPGDALAIEILTIDLADWGWTALVPGEGLLPNPISRSLLSRVPIRNERIYVSDRLILPVRPTIGCLGLAPAIGESSTAFPAYPWGGNYDLVQATTGATLLFPVQLSGGLVSLGDLHAAMGVGEATYFAVECAGTAIVRLGLRKGLVLDTPRIETPERLYTIGLAEEYAYDQARRQAIALMMTFLIEEHDLSPDEAAMVCAASVDLEFGGPAAAIVLASVPRTVLAFRNTLSACGTIEAH
jgi:amidase